MGFEGRERKALLGQDVTGVEPVLGQDVGGDAPFGLRVRDCLEERIGPAPHRQGEGEN